LRFTATLTKVSRFKGLVSSGMSPREEPRHSFARRNAMAHSFFRCGDLLLAPVIQQDAFAGKTRPRGDKLNPCVHAPQLASA
jgi:hypothetical protein